MYLHHGRGANTLAVLARLRTIVTSSRRGFTLIEGNVHSAGFTTAWPPNKQIMGRSMNLGMDLDLNGLNEELGGPTFAAINSRSYHPGGVSVLLSDGSVRFIKDRVGIDYFGNVVFVNLHDRGTDAVMAHVGRLTHL